MIQQEINVGSKTMTLESGRIAKQADGACIARVGDTVVMATVCMAKSGAPRDFLPLTVDYRENTYAGGRIPGGFFKREGRPSEKEIITCRLIDRPLRPLFPTATSTKRRSSHRCCQPTARTTPTCWRSTPRRPRSRCRRSPSTTCWAPSGSD